MAVRAIHCGPLHPVKPCMPCFPPERIRLRHSIFTFRRLAAQTAMRPQHPATRIRWLAPRSQLVPGRASRRGPTPSSRRITRHCQALRVVYVGSNTGRNQPATTLADGTAIVVGTTTLSSNASKQSAGESLFAVQTGAVWQQYSEYTFKGANSYFTALAAKNNRPVPRLPVDAGRLAVSALQSIILNGTALTQAGRTADGASGRGGELDISAPKLAVVGHAGYVANDVPAGFIGLDIAQLNGFESVLIGGIRTD